MQKMGVNSSQGLNEIAGKVGNSQPAFDNVKSTFNALALSNPGLGAIQQQSYQNTEGRFGNDQQRLAHSMMNAMLHESAYTQPGGHREGMESILGAMQATTHGMDLNAPLPGDEARNSSVGNVAPMSNRNNPYGSVEAAPAVTDAVTSTNPSRKQAALLPAMRQAMFQPHMHGNKIPSALKMIENLAQFEQGSLSTSSGYQSRQTEALIKDLIRMLPMGICTIMRRLPTLKVPQTMREILPRRRPRQLSGHSVIRARHVRSIESGNGQHCQF